MHVAMSLLDLERNDLASAAEHLRRADELGEAAGLPQNAYRWRVALARLRSAQGDTDSAVDLLDEAERVYVGDFSPNVRPIAATRARVLAGAGRVDEALRWASDSGLTTADPVSYLTEYEQVTLVRVRLAAAARSGSPTGDTMDLLERLITDARTGGRQGSLVELLVLQSLASGARGQATAAVATLETAVRLAEPEGYCRTFTSEGPAMATLLDAVSDRHAAWPYLQRLRAAMRGGRASSWLVGSRSRRRLDTAGIRWRHRTTERSRTRDPPLPRIRTGWTGHRPRAERLAQHRSHPHPTHLHQARRQQPAGSHPTGAPAGALLARRQELTTRRPASVVEDHHQDHHS